jgi:hypothetical protein
MRHVNLLKKDVGRFYPDKKREATLKKGLFPQVLL